MENEQPPTETKPPEQPPTEQPPPDETKPPLIMSTIRTPPPAVAEAATEEDPGTIHSHHAVLSHIRALTSHMRGLRTHFAAGGTATAQHAEQAQAMEELMKCKWIESEPGYWTLQC